MAAHGLAKCWTAVVTVDEMVYKLNSSNGEVTTCEIQEMSSNKDETDTLVLAFSLLPHQGKCQLW